jgi:cyclopropane-fatty-acyl-phospholipid synthase
VEFRLDDYRSAAGVFDRIVSVGMFEHVGTRNYATYFRKTAALLEPERGVMLLHSIGRDKPAYYNQPFIEKYIFPGGYIPALSEVLPAVEKSGLLVTDIEILPMHYAWTLRAWRERFMSNRDRAVELYDERFCRMWEFYLAASQTGFEYDNLFVFQMQLARRHAAVPMRRDYIAAAEAKLASSGQRLRLTA